MPSRVKEWLVQLYLQPALPWELKVKLSSNTVFLTPFPGFPGDSVGKESTCNVGVARDVGLIPGSGTHPGGCMATHFGILAWRIPWTEEPGGSVHGVAKSWIQLK